MSISSRKMIPRFSASSIASALIFSGSSSASHSCSKSTSRAWATVTCRVVDWRGMIFSSIPCRSMSMCSMPMPLKTTGVAFCSTVNSTERSSSSPEASMPRIFSRLRS